MMICANEFHVVLIRLVFRLEPILLRQLGGTATAAWYEVDRKTGKGTGTMTGESVDLTT